MGIATYYKKLKEAIQNPELLPQYPHKIETT
jgi:hypothetical protein